MPIEMRRAYLEAIRERYSKSTKKDKGIILKEFCNVCDYSRKYAIRILRGQVQPRLHRPGPKSKYTVVVVGHLKTLWASMNKMCSKKMVMALPIWLPFYKDANDEVRKLLLSMSASTIDRLLRPYKRLNLKGISTTRGFIKNKIPIKLLDEEIKEPGFIEADTVAHCGESIMGHYCHTLTMTDLYSGWTENRAVWTKEAPAVLAEVERVERVLPFNLRGFACDNGTEFLNRELYRHLFKRECPVEFVRRRPYKKNDSAHVEQKNNTHVRELLGYKRFDQPELVKVMNEIYKAFWNPIWNYFTPVMKLKEKVRIGGRVKKVYDQPKTPCQRLIESPALPSYYKNLLREQLQCKNPFYLKQELENKLKNFFDLVETYERQRKPTG
jgi:hypothetical protein